MMCDRCHRFPSQITELAVLLFSEDEFFIPCCQSCRIELLDHIDAAAEKMEFASVETLIAACEHAGPVVAVPSSALVSLLHRLLKEESHVVDKTRR